MAIEIIIPRLGWDMEEGGFGGWLKEDGDAVEPGDRVFILESDKATEDIESLDSGILHILPGGPRAGDKIAVGAIIGYLVAPGEPPPSRQASEGNAAAAEKKESAQADVASHHASHDVGQSSPRPTISPRARRVAAELGVDWTTVRGEGRTGRIRERDIVAAASARGDDSKGSPPSAPNDKAASIAASSIRKTIAERMRKSVAATAPVTLATKVDASNLVNLRHQFKTGSQGASDPLPSYTDFLVKLVAAALAKHPALNAGHEGNNVMPAQEIHVGIAVDTEAGLLVPVVRDVPRLPLRALAARTRDLAERARARKLRPEDMQGGTFTITSLGAFGIDAFTPIINFPERAILGVGRIQRQPVVLDGQIVARDMMTLSLTFDHCLVDGAPAARFLQELGKLIENPGPSLIA